MRNMLPSGEKFTQLAAFLRLGYEWLNAPRKMDCESVEGTRGERDSVITVGRNPFLREDFREV